MASGPATTVIDRRPGPFDGGDPDLATAASTTTHDDHDRRRSRARPFGVAVVLALVAVAAATLLGGGDAIVVGDGLLLGSGPGPQDVPELVWTTELSLDDPLPPVVVDETVVVHGRSDGGAALIAVDRTSGRRLWAEPLGSDRAPVALVAHAGDVTAVTSDGGETSVARFDARTGRRAWQATAVVAGGATSATALPDGRTLVVLAPPDDGDGSPGDVGSGRTVVLDADAGLLLDTDGGTAAASATAVAVLDGRTVTTFDLDGQPIGEIDAGAAAVTGLALVDDLVVVAQGIRVRGFDRGSGEQRWAVAVASDVVAIAASHSGLGVITVGDHVGLDTDGEIVWESAGYPLPLIRDGDEVTALVAPGDLHAVELTVVDADGDEEQVVDVAEGAYLALGLHTVLSGDGDDVIGTPLGGDRTPWSVDTDGEVLRAVLAGPTALIVSRDGGGVTLSSWR